MSYARELEDELEEGERFKERANREYRAWREYVETCQCPRPVRGSTYARHVHCRLCGGRIVR